MAGTEKPFTQAGPVIDVENSCHMAANTGAVARVQGQLACVCPIARVNMVKTMGAWV